MTAISLAGWLIIPRLTVCIQSASKRKHFRSYIDILHKKIESRNAVSYFEFYRSGSQEFDRQALEVRSHIRCERRKEKFDAACEAYPNLGLPFDLTNDKPNEEKRQKILACLKDILEYTK
jgi:hypothetical protein